MTVIAIAALTAKPQYKNIVEWGKTELKKSDDTHEKKKKQIVNDMADKMSKIEGVQMSSISMLIKEELDGLVGKSWIELCLPPEYKDPEESKKRKGKEPVNKGKGKGKGKESDDDNDNTDFGPTTGSKTVQQVPTTATLPPPTIVTEQQGEDYRPELETVSYGSEEQQEEIFVYEDSLEHLIEFPKWKDDVNKIDLTNCRRLLTDAINKIAIVRKENSALKAAMRQFRDNPKDYLKMQKKAEEMLGL